MGSINRATLAISDKLRKSCSAGELEQIQAWVKRYQAVDSMKRRHAALTLPEQMAAAGQWFAIASPDEARQVADDVLTAMGMLRRVLSRRELL